MVNALVDLARTMPLVFPVHPGTETRLFNGGTRALTIARGGSPALLAPRSPRFLALEAKAAFVLTDSGGLQEEMSAIGVRCFTLRDTTERPVTVELGTNTVLGAEPDRCGKSFTCSGRIVPLDRSPMGRPSRRAERRSHPAVSQLDGRRGRRRYSVLTAGGRGRLTGLRLVNVWVVAIAVDVAVAMRGPSENEPENRGTCGL